MPGKHAPPSPASFYRSLARAAIAALGALGLVIAIVVVAVSSREDPGSLVAGTPAPTLSTTPSRTATAEPSDEPTALQPSETLASRAKVRVEVLNGTPTAGLAASAESDVRGEGYQRVVIGNAPEEGRPYRTTIFYDEGFEAEAERLLRDLPKFSRVRPRTGATPGSAALTVILGEDYEA